MKKNKLFRFVFIVAVIAVLVCLSASCNAVKIKDYPAVGMHFDRKVDECISLYNSSMDHIANKSRGFRGEAYITPGTGEGYPGSGEYYYEIFDGQLKKYVEDGKNVIFSG